MDEWRRPGGGHTRRRGNNFFSFFPVYRHPTSPRQSGVYCMLRGVVPCNLNVANNHLFRRSPSVPIRPSMPAAFHLIVRYGRRAS